MTYSLKPKLLVHLESYRLAHNILTRLAERKSIFFRNFFMVNNIKVNWHAETSDILAELGLTKLYDSYTKLLLPVKLNQKERSYLEFFNEIIIANKNRYDAKEKILTLNANDTVTNLIKTIKRNILKIYRQEKTQYKKMINGELEELLQKKILIDTDLTYNLTTYLTLQKINLATQDLGNLEFLPKIKLMTFDLYPHAPIYYLKKENILQVRYLTDIAILRNFFVNYLIEKINFKKAN